MYKLEPGMAHLELDGPNSIVWMATVFGPGKQSEFQAQAPRAFAWLRTIPSVSAQKLLESSRMYRTGDAILCMMGEMRTSLNDALRTTEPLPMPKVTSPTEILDALKSHHIWRIKICSELMGS
jgi:hypothetical protein